MVSSRSGLPRRKFSERAVSVNGKASERAANVQGAFRVSTEARAKLAGRHVLLVDDVYTTGATAKAVTRALLRGGAAGVDVVVFARVVEGLG